MCLSRLTDSNKKKLDQLNKAELQWLLWYKVDRYCLLIHSRSLSPLLGMSSFYRLHTTASPKMNSSPAGFNFQSPGGSTTSFTDHALYMELMEPLVPEICLDHIWTETGNIPRLVFLLCHCISEWYRGHCHWRTCGQASRQTYGWKEASQLHKYTHHLHKK